MAQYQIWNTRSGADLGIFEAESTGEAITAMYADAGYDSDAEVAEVLGCDEADVRDDLRVEAVAS